MSVVEAVSHADRVLFQPVRGFRAVGLGPVSESMTSSEHDAIRRFGPTEKLIYGWVGTGICRKVPPD